MEKMYFFLKEASLWRPLPLMMRSRLVKAHIEIMGIVNWSALNRLGWGLANDYHKRQKCVSDGWLAPYFIESDYDAAA